MLQVRGDLHLVQEALSERWTVREVVGDYLERLESIEAFVSGEVNDAHPATAD